jgi:hypothetical protein
MLELGGQGRKTGSRPAPDGMLPGWKGINPAQAEQFESAIRGGMATDPARGPGDAGRADRATWSSLGVRRSRLPDHIPVRS